MGKDFFSRKSKSDFFETPYSMTEQLLESEKFDYGKEVLEPACGDFVISNILKNYFFKVGAYDIKYNIKNFDTNFFIETAQYDYIITNPPFSLWDEFVQKAKNVATEKFAFLGRLEFLTGISRFKNNLYTDPEYPLTKVYIFVRKVNLSYNEKYPCLREDGKYPAGMYHYAWLIFEKAPENKDYPNYNWYANYPIFRWINNQKYILSSKD